MGRILAPREPGNAIVGAGAPGEIVIDKPGKGIVHAAKLDEILKAHGIAQYVFVGVAIEACAPTSSARPTIEALNAT
jgi:hypothetical protein